MIANVAKVFQRRLYDLLTSRVGLIFLLTSFLVLFVSLLHFGEILFQWSSERYHSMGPSVASVDNLGGRSFLQDLCPPMPVDVVYTWVNGSDPILLSNLQKYQTIAAEEARLAKVAAKSQMGNASGPALPPKCIWTNCNLFTDRQLFRCPLSTTLTAAELTVVQKTNSSIFALAPMNVTTPDPCVSSPVFLTPDVRSNQKILYPEALWLTGEPFREKERDKTFYSQLSIIFERVQSSPPRKLQFLPFEAGAVLLCSPACNHSTISSTLNTFHSLQLSSREIFLVWNDTVPGNAVIAAESEETDRTSRSRYEDNEELRFSLRSVDEFAPWVRRVFLVTNGQVPAWLRLDHPRLRIVTHKEIFRNSSHLPTFNSAAIEMHLHRIPNLARRFIYMNDDVFFGAPIHPDDFFTRARGQRVYLSWAVPDCRPGCPSNWLKDGFCDKSCNYPECEFDAGDCGPDGQSLGQGGVHAAAANAWNSAMQRAGAAEAAGFGPPAPYRPFCHGPCADAWLGDGSCDAPCNRVECAFDAGDCGDRHFSQVCAAPLRNGTLSAELPPGVTEAIVDLNVLGPGLTWSYGRYRASSPHSVRTVVLAKKYQALIVIFHRNVNSTEAILSLETSNKTVRNISLIAHTNGNGSCPVSMLFHRDGPPAPGNTFPTMKPYALDQRGPKIRAKQPEPPSSETILRLEDKLRKMVNRNSNSSESLFITDAANILERKWMLGEITEKGYRIFLWKLLNGSPVRVTADRRRSTPSSRRQTPSWQKRHLLGTYAQSLIHSNRLFSRTYGHSPRKVPGHMPHFLDVRILRELEARFPEHWRQTSAHRFRSANDLQYAFSYFYFLMSERTNRTLTQWLSRFDTDHSLDMSGNELRTLSLHLWGLPFEEVKLNETLANCSVPLLNYRRVPIGALIKCEYFRNISAPQLTNASRYPFEVVGEDDIWFKMLNANYSRALHHLDEIRTERRKFVCLNDDIDHAGSPAEAAKVRRAMRQLLKIIFPKPSQFELPNGAVHNFRYRDSWLHDQQWNRTMRTLRVLAIVLFTALVISLLFRRQCRKVCLRTFRLCRRTVCCRAKSPVKV